MKIAKKKLLLIAAFVWAAAGINILRIGVSSMVSVCKSHPFWQIVLLFLAAIVVYTGFFFMFRKVVNRHATRILTYPEEKKSVYLFFDLRGYLLMAFMMGLGIVLRRFFALPTEFFAAFYTGLGAGLSTGGIRFLISYFK